MAYIPVQDIKDPEYVNAHNVVMCTKKGVIKKTTLEAYSRPRTNGINAITIREATSCSRPSSPPVRTRSSWGSVLAKPSVPRGKCAVGRTAQG